MMLHHSSRSRVTIVAVIDNIPIIPEHPQCLVILPSCPVSATANLVLLL